MDGEGRFRGDNKKAIRTTKENKLWIAMIANVLHIEAEKDV